MLKQMYMLGYLPDQWALVQQLADLARKSGTYLAYKFSFNCQSYTRLIIKLSVFFDTRRSRFGLHRYWRVAPSREAQGT